MDKCIEFTDKEYKFLSECADRFSLDVKSYILLLALSHETACTLKEKQRIENDLLGVC